MAKKPTPADLNAKAQAALEDAKKTTADAEAKLASATEAKDDEAIAKATADLNAAKELEQEAQTAADAASAAVAAASGQAPAAKVATATPEPEAPADAAPQSFMQHLQSEISAAEQAAKTDLHSWLVSLESHLGGLMAHCKRLEQEASPEIQKFVAGVKALL